MKFVRLERTVEAGSMTVAIENELQNSELPLILPSSIYDESITKVWSAVFRWIGRLYIEFDDGLTLELRR